MTLSIKKCFVFMLCTLILVTGCQRADERKINYRTGRGARGTFNKAYEANPTSANISSNKCGSYKPSSKAWGEVVKINDQNSFWNEVFYLTWPTLAGVSQEDELGYVSGTSGQSTGVRFWGHVESASGNGYGPINPQKSQIRIEIYDDKACSSNSDGTTIPVIPIHIGAGQPGFTGVQGTIQNGYLRVIFSDEIGAIELDGTFNGSQYTGTMRFSIPGHTGVLGRFAVPTCSFFTCN